MTSKEMAAIVRRGAEVVRYASVCSEDPVKLTAELDAVAAELDAAAEE